MHLIEDLMYQLSSYFLPPVLIAIIILFIYSLFAFGDFTTQLLQRKKNQKYYKNQIDYLFIKKNKLTNALPIKGFDVFNHATTLTHYNEDILSVFALKKLELVRIVTRIAPMLGLVATMIPMGPALKSLSDGNIQGISENLVVAFSAVIFGLIISSMTYWIAAVKKRWLADEIVDLLSINESK